MRQRGRRAVSRGIEGALASRGYRDAELELARLDVVRSPRTIDLHGNVHVRGLTVATIAAAPEGGG